MGAWLASDGITAINQADTTALIAGLMGDTIVKRLGTTRVIVLGGLFAAMGMALATLAPSWEVALLGYAGILAGPAAIGFIVHANSLSSAFLLITALLISVAISGRILRV